MTKPGNSDHDEPDRAEDEAREPEPETVEPEPEPVDPEPLMTELEKAPPPPEEPVMPTAREAARARSEGRAPTPLRVSFYLFVASALVWVLFLIAAMISKQDLIDAQIKINKDPKLTDEKIASIVTQVLWLGLILAVTFAVFLALFGYKAAEGVRRARTLVTIIGVILVMFDLVLDRSLVGLFSGFLGLVALIALYLPSSRAYFPPYEPR